VKKYRVEYQAVERRESIKLSIEENAFNPIANVPANHIKIHLFVIPASLNRIDYHKTYFN